MSPAKRIANYKAPLDGQETLKQIRNFAIGGIVAVVIGFMGIIIKQTIVQPYQEERRTEEMKEIKKLIQILENNKADKSEVSIMYNDIKDIKLTVQEEREARIRLEEKFNSLTRTRGGENKTSNITVR